MRSPLHPFPHLRLKEVCRVSETVHREAVPSLRSRLDDPPLEVRPVDIRLDIPAVPIAHPAPPADTYSYPCASYLQLPRNQETWLIKPLIPVGGAVNVFGDAKVGKSWLALQLAMALSDARAASFLGFTVTQHGRVLYVQLDTPRSLWMGRLDDIVASGAEIDLQHLYMADRESFGTWPFDIAKPDHFSRLREEVTRIAPIAVIIDTLKEANQADENDSTAAQGTIARLVAATRPAALVLISHSRKGNADVAPSLINDNRGSNYIPGRMDAILRMTKRHLIYIGRSVEEGTIKLKRLDSGLWAVDEDEVEQHLAAVLADPLLTSSSARAKALSVRSGKSEEACRSLLRRRSSEPTTTTA